MAVEMILRDAINEGICRGLGLIKKMMRTGIYQLKNLSFDILPLNES
jgi:hypothetical protein